MIKIGFFDKINYSMIVNAFKQVCDRRHHEVFFTNVPQVKRQCSVARKVTWCHTGRVSRTLVYPDTYRLNVITKGDKHATYTAPGYGTFTMSPPPQHHYGKSLGAAMAGFSEEGCLS